MTPAYVFVAVLFLAGDVTGMSQPAASLSECKAKEAELRATVEKHNASRAHPPVIALAVTCAKVQAAPGQQVN